MNEHEHILKRKENVKSVAGDTDIYNNSNNISFQDEESMNETMKVKGRLSTPTKSYYKIYFANSEADENSPVKQNQRS